MSSFFEKEQRARKLYDIVEEINLMKKAMLARAVSGELGTNEPRERAEMIFEIGAMNE